jgi:hypothetical protein
MIKRDKIRFQKNELINSLILMMLVTCISFSSALAQIPQQHATLKDTLELPPGTLHVSVMIKNIKNHQATVVVMEVLGEGQGIVNVLSKDQLFTISLPEKVKMSKGQKIDVYLKEKVGVDASQSTYSWLRGKDF